MEILFLSDFLPDKNLVLDKSVEELINNADYVVFNLEGSPLLPNEQFHEVNQIMPFDVDYIVDFLNKFGREKFLIALANNHILDNKVVAFDYLIEKFNENGITYFGTKDAPSITINNFSILNFVTGETVAKRKEGVKRLNYLFYDASQINKQINGLNSNTCILYPHWGRDMDTQVFNTYKNKLKIPKKWFVFGHHPHVISGIYKNFIYSMGNSYIPHPYYYDKYPSTRFGIAIVLNTESNSYKLNLTTLEKQNFNFLLSSSNFTNIPGIVQEHGKDFKLIKRVFLKILAFKGGFFDYFKLCFLQFMTVIFELKYKMTKRSNS